MFSKWRTRKDEREKGAPEELTGVPNPLSEVYSLAKDLNNWIRRPQAGGPDISDLDGVKKFKDKYENREILEDGKEIAEAATAIVTISMFAGIPDAESTHELKRYIELVKYFIGESWVVASTAVQGPLRMFWGNEDLGFVSAKGDNSDTGDDESEDEAENDGRGGGVDERDYSQMESMLAERQQWKDLKGPEEVESCDRYLRLHDYIAQLIGQGLVKTSRYPNEVFRTALEKMDAAKGDPARDAAFAAAYMYIYHAGPQLKAMANDPPDFRARWESVLNLPLAAPGRPPPPILHGRPLTTLAKAATTATATAPVVVDVHPDRPAFRGVMVLATQEPISLQADPTVQELRDAGAAVRGEKGAHTVLDDMFLVSGAIPRETDYEGGIRGGITFNETSGEWEKDELIMDERFVMCHLKGKGLVVFTGRSHAGVLNVSRHAVRLGGGGRVPLYSVVGGYHLADASAEKMDQSLRDLEALEPEILMPGHCTVWRFKARVEKGMPGHMAPIFGGTKYELV